jgi:hypothetical protein
MESDIFIYILSYFFVPSYVPEVWKYAFSSLSLDTDPNSDSKIFVRLNLDPGLKLI